MKDKFGNTVLPENMNRDRFKPQGIGLYKIRYEMDVVNSTRDHNYVAGIIANNNKEAVDTLVAFAAKKVTGFKGLRIAEVGFEGLVHDLSPEIREMIVKTAILNGEVVSKSDYDALLEEGKKSTKKSIIPKDKKKE